MCLAFAAHFAFFLLWGLLAFWDVWPIIYTKQATPAHFAFFCVVVCLSCHDCRRQAVGIYRFSNVNRRLGPLGLLGRLGEIRGDREEYYHSYRPYCPS